ncbi:MAG: hypothetical protein R3C19_19550 [Planctomycetaceae bacterium]
MLFRFASAILLVVAVSMIGVALERQSLRLRRSVSRQYYQTDLLLELHARRRLRIQQLTAPAQLAALRSDSAPATRTLVRDHGRRDRSFAAPDTEPAANAEAHPSAGSRLPLLRWERPVNPAVLE